MPRSDFMLIRHRMLAPEKMGWKYKAEWMKEHAHEIEQLLQHIQHNGPVRSADFEHLRKGPAVGGHGNRISVILKACSPPGK